MREIYYEMPNEVVNNYRGFSFFAEMYSDLAAIKKKHIIFDFANTVWFEANFVAVFSSIFEVLCINGCRVSFANVKPKIKEIFKKNGFYKLYELGSVEDTYNSTIPFRIFNTSDEEGFTRYLDEEVIPKINLDLNKEQVKMFKKCLQEVFENTRIHANSEIVFACGQYFHKSAKVAFTLADLGKTIGENVRKKVDDQLIDSDAIQWSTEFGNTTKPSKDGGIGLHFLKDQMYNNGVLSIVSGKGYWEQSMDSVFSKKMQYNFKGTIVNIVSDLRKEIKSEVNEIWF